MSDRITVVGRIASGESADVYEARRDGKPVALKVLHPHLADDPVVRARFLREAQSVSDVRHANVVRVDGIVEHEGRPAMVMELVPGGSLAGRTLNPDETLRLLRGVLVGLDALHARGIVHRDLRPSHILLGAGGTPKIADFAMASIRELSGLTRSTVMTSRPHYVDPAAWGRGRRDPASDLYSAGATFCEVLTGDPPARSIFGAERSARRAISGIDHFVVNVIESLLAPADRRPRSAREALAWIDSGTGPARRISECLYCGAPMPADAAICVSCRREPPSVRLDRDGEFLVLKKISEAQDVLTPFRRRLSLLAGPGQTIPPLLTGDIRLYSRAERDAGIQLPVVIASGIASESVIPLIALLEGRDASQVDITRYPMRKLHRFKRGPLVHLSEGVVVPPASTTALRRLAVLADPTTRPDSSSAHLRIECAHAVAVAARRVAAAGVAALDPESIRSLGERLFAVVDRIEQQERYLSEIDLHEAYAALERSSARGEDASAAGRRAAELVEQYAEAHRDAATARYRLSEACRRLESIEPQRLEAELHELGRVVSG